VGRRLYTQQAARFRKEIRPPSAEDIKQADIIEAGTKALVASLRPLLEENPHRLLRTLQKHEVEGAVVAVISAYIAKRQELAEAAAKLSDRIDDIGVLAA